MTARDTSVRPGDDFWAYANGAWSARTPIPADLDAVGLAPQLSREAQERVRVLLEGLARDRAGRPDDRRVGDFYASWMDEAAVEARGLSAAQPYLARIARARTGPDLQALLADVVYASPIALGVVADPADPTRDIVSVGQGELGMPREYFLNGSERYVAIRAAYRAYVERLLTEAGVPRAAERASAILALETEIARTQLAPGQSRDATPARSLSLEALQAQAPQWDWPLVLQSAGLGGAREALLGDEAALQALGGMLTQEPTSLWKDYLTFRFLSQNAELLPRRFATARFAFYSGVLAGVSEPPPRWRRGVVLMNQQWLGDAVGAAYVERYLSPESHEQVRAIFEDVREAFRVRIVQASWMDEATKAGALDKIATLQVRIGASGPAPDYSGLRIDRGDLLGNVVRLARFKRAREQEGLAKVQRPDYPMTPQGVNGYYYAPANSILLEAGLLAPPFFDPAADPAVNYGAIGVFIGHEMGHAFDDQGSRYDAAGRVRDWWTSASRATYQQRLAALKAQYAAHEVLPGLKVDADLTLGENIADLAGLEAAHAAYQRYLARTGPAPLLEGLTGEQRFFLAQAQTRRTKLREDVARQLAAVDTHAPPMLRIDAVVRNSDAWYAAFGVEPSDALYLPPDDRVRIW